MTRWSAEGQRNEGRQERSREQRGLQGHARNPVALPDLLHALTALGEMAAAVDELLQPPADCHYERYPGEGTSYAEGAAQGGGKA